MALDHYVSQVHLRNFYSPALGERMYAIRKRDGKAFTPNSESVCRIEEGSTNAYLVKDRAVEDFLKEIEPKYNAVVRKLLVGEIDHECVYVIAGFAAYVGTCSPAAIRIHSGPLKAILESSARALEASGAFPPLPESLGGSSLTELLQSGKLTFTIDPKYPQAIGISNIVELTKMLGNVQWEILLNDYAESPFFTSDSPLAIEESNNPVILNRILPLTPHMAVRILPDDDVHQAQCDLSFSRFRYRFRHIERQEVLAMNRLFVKCAEELVFYRDNHPWVTPFVEKYSPYRVEAYTHEVPRPTGVMQISTQRVVRLEGTAVSTPDK